VRRIALVLALVASCGTPPNNLAGSVLESYPDMAFDTVALSRIDPYFVVEYEKGKDGSGGKVAKLSVYIADLTIAAGNTVDLTGTVGTNPRATLQRVTVSDPADFGIDRGTLVFDAPPDAGQTISGHFHITTHNPSGRTLNGDFKAAVVQK
jgi:hypothetical protein